MMRVRELASLKEALEAVRRAFRAEPLGTEEVRLEGALGRVLAEDVVAPIDVPGFRRALMDGYAVRAEDTFGASLEAPVELKLVGEVEVGRAADIKIGPGECAAISTGAMLPEGADAVVKVEATTREDDRVLAFEAVAPGQNVMAADADVKAGDVILRAGDLITPQRLGILSALGLRSVKVFRRPKVAIISTGVELVPPGGRLGPGQVYDINWASLHGAVRLAGGEPVFLGIARDRLDELTSLLSKGLELADLVVATGASSVGASDLMREALAALGARVIVDGVRCKPGKPTIIAEAGGKPVFCLPGKPTSALVTFTVFVEPILAKLAGLKGIARPTVKATLAARVVPDAGRHNFVPVVLSKGAASGRFLARPVFKDAAAITALGSAHGYVEMPEGTEFLPEGAEVEVVLFWPAWPLGRSDIEP